MNAVLAWGRVAAARLTALLRVARPALARGRGRIARTPVGGALRVVTPLGRVVLAVVVVAWFAGRTLGWAELVLAAVLGGVVLVASTGLTVGRVSARGTVSLERERVTAGASIGGALRLAGPTRRRLVPLVVELPVGDVVRRFDVPASATGAPRHEVFAVDTDRRGVIVVGPATTVRGDPFGLLRRAAPLADAVELFVHPVTVSLPPLAGGLLRDLEGRTTEDVSMSDLAFHALRQYVPGDDRRHIHWRSSARALSVDHAAGGSPGDMGLLVRQFNDTRRSHVMVVVDGDADAYARPDDAELAMSVGASVVTRAIRDELETTVVAADRLAMSASTGRGVGRAQRVLDAFAQATFTTGTAATPLRELAARGLRATSDVTTALLVTGSGRAFADLRRAAAWFPPEVAVVAVRVDSGGRSSRSSAGALTVLDVEALADLPALLRGGVTVGSRS